MGLLARAIGTMAEAEHKRYNCQSRISVILVLAGAWQCRSRSRVPVRMVVVPGKKHHRYGRGANNVEGCEVPAAAAMWAAMLEPVSTGYVLAGSVPG
jgi:hypothetical protein